MVYGRKAMLADRAGRPHTRPLRWLYATIVGDDDPHAHVRWAAARRALTRLSFPKRSIRVLEIGSGHGVMTYELIELLDTRSITACDIISPPRSRPAANFLIGDTTRLPLLSDSYDLVTLVDVIEHIDADDEALSEAFRVVVPGGYALVSVPTAVFPRWFGRRFHDDIGHVRDGYTQHHLLRALRGAGFVPVCAEHHTGLLALLVAWLYYNRLRCRRVARELASVACRALGVLDMWLPSPTWGGLVVTAVKPDQRVHEAPPFPGA